MSDDGKRAIYIVESDASVRQSLARLIQAVGLEPRPCDCLEDLLRQAAGAHDGCMLLDLSTPGLAEEALSSRIRQMAEKIPVIALSVRDDPAARSLARTLGAKAFFRKPVDSAALLDSIDWVTHGLT